MVVFELKDPNTLTLIVHIFRVKDYTFVRVANLGKAKQPDSSTVSTPSKMESFTCDPRMRLTAENRKNDQPPGQNDRVEPKLLSPMAPQYAAVAKYFANRGSPSAYEKAFDQEAQRQKTTEAYGKRGTSSCVFPDYWHFMVFIFSSNVREDGTMFLGRKLHL